MVSIEYASDFVRKYKKLEPALRSEVRERIDEFRDARNHRKLKVHKLGGPLKGLYAFSVNYADRIIFEWGKDRRTAYLLDVGDHSVYD